METQNKTATELQFIDELAKSMVGDGKLPNVFFVTAGCKVHAMFIAREDAITYAENSFHHLIPVVVEDRIDGTTWENETAKKVF